MGLGRRNLGAAQTEQTGCGATGVFGQLGCLVVGRSFRRSGKGPCTQAELVMGWFEGCRQAGDVGEALKRSMVDLSRQSRHPPLFFEVKQSPAQALWHDCGSTLTRLTRREMEPRTMVPLLALGGE